MIATTSKKPKPAADRQAVVGEVRAPRRQTSRLPQSASKLMGWGRTWVNKQTTLGIDIGLYETKLVALNHGLKQLHVSRTKIPSGLFEPQNSGTPAEERRVCKNPFQKSESHASELRHGWCKNTVQGLVQRIKESSGSRSHHDSDVFVNLSMAFCDLRGICIPKDSVRSSASIQSVLNESLNDSEPRTLALLPSDDPRQSKLSVFSIPQRMTTELATSMEQHALIPRQIDGLPWCLARLATLESRPSQKTDSSLYLDWSFGRPTLVFVVDQSIRYARRLNSGSILQLLSQTMQDLELSAPEASRWLEYCAKTSQHEGVVGDCIHSFQSCCRQLGKELSSALEFIRWKYKQEAPSSICVVGGGGAIQPLCDWLGSSVDLPVTPWKLRIEDEYLTSEYAVAASLAFLGAKP